ncbi:MAG: GNAT family N-acetyltransferase [Myxococcota bacterium]
MTTPPTPPQPKYPTGYRIENARSGEAVSLHEIEIEAASHFPEEALPRELRKEGLPLRVLEEAAREERLWIAVEVASNATVGFALAILADGSGHLLEVDVLPDHGRRGLGRALVSTVAGWAQRRGLASLTLTTFRHLAWNAPFYRSLGFEEIPPEAWQPEFRARVKSETARMEPEKRIAMELRPPIPRQRVRLWESGAQ